MATWRAGHDVGRFAGLLAERGYSLAPLPDGGDGVLATKRGHSVGFLLPYTDFIFLHDLDLAQIADGEALEALHRRNRVWGESQMRVPRALRYRVPNTVTVGVTATGASEEMRLVASRERRSVNTGEKNSMYLVDTAAGRAWSHGLEQDPIRLGGTWTPDVNPNNRVARLLGAIIRELGAAMSAPGVAPDEA
jgi:hypothetical protein